MFEGNSGSSSPSSGRSGSIRSRSGSSPSSGRSGANVESNRMAILKVLEPTPK